MSSNAILSLTSLASIHQDRVLEIMAQPNYWLDNDNKKELLLHAKSVKTCIRVIRNNMMNGKDEDEITKAYEKAEEKFKLLLKKEGIDDKRGLSLNIAASDNNQRVAAETARHVELEICSPLVKKSLENHVSP